MYNGKPLIQTLALVIFICLLSVCKVQAQNNWFLFDAPPLFPQHSPYTYIYKIPFDSVNKYVYDNDTVSPKTSWLQHPAYVIPFNDYRSYDSILDAPSTPVGYYMAVDADRNIIHTKIGHRKLIEVFTSYLRPFSLIIVKDNAGNVLKKASVSMNGKPATYNDTLGGYTIQNLDNDENGKILISYMGDLLVYNYEKSANYAYQQQHRSNPSRLNDENNDQYNGYLVTNKPVYKPGDTVKYKAYLLYADNNKPVNEPINLQVQNGYYYSNNTVATIDRKIYPKEAGVYYGEFILGDSLQTDRSYTLKITGNKTGIHITDQFDMRDYLLDQTRLRVTGEDYPMYQHGDSVGLYAFGYTTNNLPVLDGTISITVTHSYLGSVTLSKYPLFIPDTLYHATVAVNPDGETNIGFSTTSFPVADMTLHCKVSLTNSNYETHDTVFDIAYVKRPAYIKLSHRGNNLHAVLIDHKHEVPGKGLLSNWHQNNIPITYPSDYILTENDRNVQFSAIDSQSHTIDTRFYYQSADSVDDNSDFWGDTAYLSINNPQKIKIRYTLYSGNDFIGYGRIDNDTTLNIYSPKSKTVTMLATYIWQGEERNLTFHVYKMERNMHVGMQKKDFIYPGQKDTIRVSLTDREKNPVANTNVTVFAFNSQFKEDYVPDLPYGGLLNPPLQEERILVSIDQRSMATDSRFDVTEDWLKICAADTMFFYRNIYMLPYKIAWMVYAMTDTNAPTQMGIYLKSKNNFLLPDVIYVDDKPVYIKGVNTTDPHALFIPPGTHNVRIRTARFQYTIPRFDVFYQMKTDMILNVDSLVPGVLRDTLTANEKSAEQNRLAACLVMYRTMQKPYRNDKQNYPNYGTPWLKQGKNIFKGDITDNYRQSYQGGSYQVALFGPVDLNDSIHFYQQNNIKTTFQPQANYIFSLQPGMTTVEHENTGDYYSSYYTYDQTEWIELGHVHAPIEDFDSLPIIPPAYTPLVVQKITAKKQANRPRTGYEVHYSLKQLRFTKHNSDYPSDVSLVDQVQPKYVILRSAKDSLLIITNATLFSIPPGTYQLFVIQNNDSMAVNEHLIVPPYGHLYIPQVTPHSKFNYTKAPIWLQPFVRADITYFKEDKKKWKNAQFLLVNGPTSIDGQVLDEKGQPVIGAVLKLTIGGIAKAGAVTDYDGKYEIKPLAPGRYDLETNYKGYKRNIVTGIIVGPDKITVVNQKLEIIGNQLHAATVTAYKTPLIDAYAPAETITLTTDQIEKMPSRNVSDMVSESAAIYQNNRGNELDIMGGRTDGTQYSIDGVQNNGTANTAIDEDENGNVPYVASKKANTFINDFLKNTMAAAGLRKNFRDWAIWEPDLWTDKDGQASFSVTYPDNMTAWKTYVLAMNPKGYSAKVMRLTRAFKPLAAELSAPRFLRYGDTVTVLGKVMNYTHQPLSLHTTFLQDSITKHSDTMMVHNGRVEELMVTAPTVNTYDTSTLSLTYSIKTNDGYTDGEKQQIPVFPVGNTETRGILLHLYNDTTIQTTHDTTAGHFSGITRISVDGDLVNLMLHDVEQLKEYPYGCNEQLTTKLLAIYYEELIKTKMGRSDFNNTKAKKQIIEKLVKNQNADGSYGWWGSGTYDYRITNYVISTLARINEDHKLDVIINKGYVYLVNNLDRMDNDNLIAALTTLSEGNYKAAYDYYTKRYDRLQLSAYNRASLLLIKQQQHLPYGPQIDSLMEDSVHDDKEVYWTNGYRRYNGYYYGYYDWYHSDLATTLRVYKLFANDKQYTAINRQLLDFIIKKRPDGYYRNTAESGMVLSTILPDLLKTTHEKDLHTRVLITGSLNDSVSQFPKYYSIKNSDPHFSISKKGISHVYVSVSYSYFNTQPQVHDSVFSVTSSLLKDRQQVTILKQGDKAVLHVSVNCEKQADYVMIEVPIPAGCVQQKSNDAYYYNEANRENFKDRTVIFCNTLYKGQYQFDVPIEARYKGVFNVNPARVEMMYYPEVYGNTPVKKVTVQ